VNRAARSRFPFTKPEGWSEEQKCSNDWKESNEGPQLEPEQVGQRSRQLKTFYNAQG